MQTENQEESPTPIICVDDDSLLPELVEAITDQRTDDAIALAEAYLSRDLEIEPLSSLCQDAAILDHRTRPIVIAHLIKTCIASLDEHQALGEHPQRHKPVLAFIRVAASPIRERWLSRFVEEALRFVEQSKVPRRLT